MNNRYVRVLTLNALQFALLAFLYVGLGAKEYVDPTSNNLYTFALAAGGGSVAAILLTLCFYKLVDKKPLRELNFRFNRKHLLFSLTTSMIIAGGYLAFVSFVSANGAITAIFNWDFFENSHAIPMFLAVGAAWFLAAFNEELADRAYFVSNFKDLGIRKIYLFSSILFTVSHFFKSPSPLAILFYVGMGIVFMFVYIKTDSVLAASLPHFVLNFIMGQPVGDTDISILRITSGELNEMQLMGFSIFAAVTLIVLTMLFYRKRE